MKPFLIRTILGTSLALAATLVLAADAAQVLERVRGAVFTVVASANDYGVINVIGHGSAVLVAPGRLVTACSVVDNATGIAVSRRQDRIVEKVRLARRDPNTGLCELTLTANAPGFDRPAVLAPAGTLRAGTVIHAVGAPEGMDLSAQTGSVTALREAATGERFVLVSTALVPGLRGAGLFDDQGRLVAVVAEAAQDAGIPGYAVAAESIRPAQISGAATAGPSAAATTGTTPRPTPSQTAAPPSPAAAAGTPGSAPKPATPQQSGSPAPGNQVPQDQAARDLGPRLAGSGDNDVVQRRYREMAAGNALAGLDDAEAVARIYAAVIADAVMTQMRWDEGGDHAAEFEVRLHRSGELMFTLPVRPSGLEAFDLAAQRAIGVASPFPVPRDDAAFEKLQSLTLTVRPPKRSPQSAPKPAAAPAAPKPPSAQAAPKPPAAQTRPKPAAPAARPRQP